VQVARRGAGPVPGLAEQLTGQELEILVLLAAGMPNPRIAAELVVTLDTVKSTSATCWASSRGQPRRGRRPRPPARPVPLATHRSQPLAAPPPSSPRRMC
jgi:hypothetical protein